MAIKSKNSGTYADIAGVSVKTAGTYAAVQGIYAKSGGAYESVFSGISEKTFSVTLSGITGATPSSVQAIVTINQVGNLNPIILTNRSSGVGPLAIVFDAKSSQISPALSSLPFLEVDYSWHFGDSASAAQTWDYGTCAGVATRNTAIGPVAGHVFENAGSYTVTLTARFRTVGGSWVTKTTTSSVTVTSAEALATVYVSTDVLTPGSGGVPAGANVQTITDYASLSTLANTYKRILLQRSKTYTSTGSFSPPDGPGLLGAWGSGDDPILDMTTDSFGIYLNGNAGNGDDWRIVDIKVTSGATSGSSRRAIRAMNCSNALLLRCDMSAAWIGLDAMNVNGLYVVDTFVHDTFTAQGGAIAGYLDRIDHLMIAGSRVSNVPDNHAWRVQGTSKCAITHSTFELPKTTGSVLTIRGKEDVVVGTWTGEWTEDVVVSDNIIDGSTGSGFVFYFGPVNAQAAERCRNLICERNLIKAKNAYAAYLTGVSGVVFRNNIIKTTEYNFAIGVGAQNDAGSPAPSSTDIYGNTIWKPDASVLNGFSAVYISAAAGNASKQSTGTAMRNNLVYAPGNTRDGATNGTEATFLESTGVDSSRYTVAASNSNLTQLNTVNPFTVSSPVNPVDYTPTGYALGAGEYVPASRDFFGADVVIPIDLGAIQ